MNTVIFRPMTIDDVDAVTKIEHDTFPTPWSRDSFLKEVSENNMARYIVAEKGDVVIGYGGLWHVINEMHITNIAVTKDFRGLGIGKGLVTELLKMAEEDELVTSISLEVRRSNFTAQNLYRKYGFTVIGIREKYYENDREDAFIMQKNIGEYI